MPGLVPGIHDFPASLQGSKTWVAGTSPATTERAAFHSSGTVIDVSTRAAMVFVSILNEATMTDIAMQGSRQPAAPSSTRVFSHIF
jgi:hypothetical protein